MPNFQAAVDWSSNLLTLDEWLVKQPLYRTKTLFNQLGFVSVRDLVTKVSRAFRDRFSAAQRLMHRRSCIRIANCTPSSSTA